MGDEAKSTVFGPQSLEFFRESMNVFARERDWGRFHQPRNLVLALVGEVGEVAECLQWKGEVAVGLPGWSAREKEHLGEELSDVLLYLVRLADRSGIDLASAAVRKMSLNRQKYPAVEARGRSDKYTAYASSPTAAFKAEQEAQSSATSGSVDHTKLTPIKTGDSSNSSSGSGSSISSSGSSRVGSSGGFPSGKVVESPPPSSSSQFTSGLAVGAGIAAAVTFGVFYFVKYLRK